MVPAAGFPRSSGTGTASHRTPGGHAVCACATPANVSPQNSTMHAMASAPAALRANLPGERDIAMTPFVVTTPATSALRSRASRTTLRR